MKNSRMQNYLKSYCAIRGGIYGDKAPQEINEGCNEMLKATTQAANKEFLFGGEGGMTKKGSNTWFDIAAFLVSLQSEAVAQEAG